MIAKRSHNLKTEPLGKQLVNMQSLCQRDVKQNESGRLRQPEYGCLLRKGSSRSWLEERHRCNKNNDKKSDNSICSPIKQRKLDPLDKCSQLQSPNISPQLLTPRRRCRESVRMHQRSLYYSQRNRMSNRNQSRMPHLPFCEHPVQRSASCPSHITSHKNHRGSEHSRRREYPESEHSRRREYPGSEHSRRREYPGSEHSRRREYPGSEHSRRRQYPGSEHSRRRQHLPASHRCNTSQSFKGKGRGSHRHQTNGDFGRKPSARLHAQGTPKIRAIKAVLPTGMEVSCGQSEEKQPIMFLQLTTEGDIEKLKTVSPCGKLDLPHCTYPGWYEDYEKAETAHKNGDAIQLERYVQRLKKRQCVHEGDRSHPHLVQLDALRLNYPSSIADVQKLEELHFNLLESEESQFWEKLEYLKSEEQVSLNMIHCDMKQINEAPRKLVEVKQIHLDRVRVAQARGAILNIVNKFSKPRAP